MQTAGSVPLGGSNADGRIEAVLENWTARLIDLSRRNNLLFFRDLRTGTLDLRDADQPALDRLLTGDRVRASTLYPEGDSFERARKSLTEIRRKIRLINEERGIDAGYVAIGLAGWPVPQGTGDAAETRSPIILRPLTITAKGANAADFELQVNEPGQLNPVLVYALSRQTGADTAGLIEAVGNEPVERRLESATTLVGKLAATAGLTVRFDEKMVAGTFAYEKLPMVRDLEDSAALLARHPLTAALAGDPRAVAELLEHQEARALFNVNAIQPEHEHLVVDADPSQQAAIARILGGSNLIVQGPPGTGKSQTIANLIAEAAARGMKVLFVAQKRAAIDAVVANLRRCDLGDIVLDLHDPKTSRKTVVEQLKSSLDQAGQQTTPDLTEVNRRLIDRRSRIIRHSEAMGNAHRSAGLSITEIEHRLLKLNSQSDLRVRLSRRSLEEIPLRRLHELQDDLATFVDSDGLNWWRGDSPWAEARGVLTQDSLRATQLQLGSLNDSEIHRVRKLLDNLLLETGLPRPDSIKQWGEALELMIAVERTVSTYGPNILDGDLEERQAAFATRAWRKQMTAASGFWRRRAVRAEVKAGRAGTATRATVFEELSAAVELRDRWIRLSGRAPSTPPSLAAARPGYETLRDNLAAIGAAAAMNGLPDKSDPEIDRALRELRSDETTLLKLPRFNQQRNQYEHLGLAALIAALAERKAPSGDARDALEHAWLSSWLQEMRIDIPEYGGFATAALDRLLDEFCEADRQHIGQAASRVRRAVAERQINARDTWPEQRQVVLDQVSRKRGHKSIRRLVDEAPDLLLTVRPCWAMSPLVVSQVLPGRELFDLVVFDEASQVEPADAIPAIMRGKTVVIAGDNKQLPPTPFFATAGSDDDDEAIDDLGDFESILDALAKFIPTQTLAWHYRSQDERLIAFSNQRMYDNRLVTFPGTAQSSSLRHVLVNGPIPPGTKAYGPAHVEAVVDLVMQHAAQTPENSLGVIALGTRGAAAIDRRLRHKLSERPELSGFFDQDRGNGQRFFVKSIENVQGDERDSIILAVDVSRSATGSVSHSFGPINQTGGERRLNVAVTRARRALTVVSTFTHNDLIEEKLTSAGLRFLHDFLQFAIHQSVGVGTPEQHEISPIAQHVVERLRRAGITAYPHYGVNRPGIDIATEAPDQPGRMQFAIETDGPSYYAGDRSVRERDRLRPQQLERMGWHHRRVWTAEWLRDPETVVARLLADIESTRDTEPIHIQPLTEDLSQMAVPTPPPARRPTRPSGVEPGAPIQQQPAQALENLARWIASDGLLRDEEQMIDAMMVELGYSRRGKNIVLALRRAIRAARHRDGS